MKMARPRAFDEGEILDHAMDVFWRCGYDGASMAELTKAMGINAPSVYVAFGNKRGLFEAVLDRYQQRRAAHKAWVLAGATARESAERMLFGAIEWLTDPKEPRGCLLIQAGLSSGTGNEDIPQELARRRKGIETVLKKRFEQAKTQGDLPPDADSTALARYIHMIFSGVGVLAASGASAAELNEIAQRALSAWPT
jgi:AcrR family transcriptional regulator